MLTKNALHILTLFLGFFWADTTQKKFGNNIFRPNSTRAIDWCVNCHIVINDVLKNHVIDLKSVKNDRF
jgi:hypothetical protein